MRAAIINKFLASGDRLVEAKIAKSLEVSITPVRHAFAQLAKEGLIDVFPYKGTYVKQLTRKFISEASNIRVALELQAADQAFDNLTHKDIRKMADYANILESAISHKTSLYEISVSDTRFHDIIFEKSNNELLNDLWVLIRPRIQFISSHNKSHIPGNLRKERHMLLIKDIRDKDKAKFLDDLKDHCQMLLEDYSEQE